MNKLTSVFSDFKKTEKLSISIIITILCLSIVALVWSWIKGLSNIINWDIISELHQTEVLADTYSDGTLKFGINGIAYFVQERYAASPMQIHAWAGYFFLFCFVLGIVIVLSGIVQKKRIWFFILMLFLAIILLAFRFENIFKTTNQYLFLAIFLPIAGLSYYMNAWLKKSSFLKNSLYYLFVLGVLAAFIITQKQIKEPVLALANYGLIAAIISFAIFVFFIAHETITSLMSLVISTGIKKSNHFKPFLILSIIYLLNTILIYLENARVIDWNVMIISPILLYIISMILGFWGFKSFCEQTALFNFKEEGVWVYLGLALISTATIAYIMFMGNDPLKEAIEDYIAICHLVVGAAFIIHILVNFSQALQQGLEVHKVLYKPAFSRLLLARIGAVMGVVVLLSIKNFFAYQQTMAGYNNAIADYYVAEGDWVSAEAFYKEATHYDLYNHKSNYALASLAVKLGDKVNASFFFKQALFKNPSAYAFVGLSQNLQAADMFFDALFVMRDGLKKFPNDAHLLTNMAYLQAKAKQTDSTFYYMNLAQQNCKKCGVEEANLAGFWAENANKEKLEAVIKESQSLDYSSYGANISAINKKVGVADGNPKIQLPKDSILSISTFAILYNQVTNKTNQTGINDDALRAIQNKAENEALYEDIAYMRAFQQYYRVNKIEGLKQLAVLANDSTQNRVLNRQTAGMWFLQEGIYSQAIHYLNKAGDKSSVNLLEEKNYRSKMAELQKNQANSLLKNKTPEAALAKAPLNPFVIEKVCKILNAQKGNEQKAYNIIFSALELNTDSPLLWKLYTEQSLRIGMLDYAENGLNKYKAIASPADYQAFLSTYQAQKALVEKSRENF